MAKRWRALHRRKQRANRHHDEPAYRSALECFDFDDDCDYDDGDPFEDDGWDCDDWDDDEEPETWSY